MLLDADVQAGIVVDRHGAVRGLVTVDTIAERMRSGDHVVHDRAVRRRKTPTSPSPMPSPSREANAERHDIDWAWIASNLDRSWTRRSSTSS